MRSPAYTDLHTCLHWEGAFQNTLFWSNSPSYSSDTHLPLALCYLHGSSSYDDTASLLPCSCTTSSKPNFHHQPWGDSQSPAPSSTPLPTTTTSSTLQLHWDLCRLLSLFYFSVLWWLHTARKLKFTHKGSPRLYFLSDTRKQRAVCAADSSQASGNKHLRSNVPSAQQPLPVALWVGSV